MNHIEVNTSKASTFDVEKIRKDFPILNKMVRNKPLIYLDNAATTQKPLSVINKISEYYSLYNSNVHRGVHSLSEAATKAYEDSRTKIKNFLNASSEREIIFTRGTTESINLVAYSYGRKFLSEGDEIIISAMEHHSNIVPWQLLAEEKKLKLKVIPINDKGELLLDEFDKLLSPKTKLVSIVYISNSLGTINPIEYIIKKAHENGTPVLIDAAQAVNHITVDVQKLDCDFLAFSGHKLFGPTGIGVLYGKEKLLEKMPPFQGGGDMIESVTFDKTTYNALPYKFEAGTPNIAGTIGLGAAIDYVQSIGFENIFSYELELLRYAEEKIREVKGIRIIGEAENKASVLSFVFDEVHPHDVGTFLDFEGIAIRTGHHCTQPIMKRYSVPATSRASFAFYNTKEEVDVLVSSLKKIIEVFK
ncbi:MAG TPA: cysteine desulfurase [Ignavibacteriaceae bacterium]|nr:cysteine desulfurase [Ignavibacteriaceae bacterium]